MFEILAQSAVKQPPELMSPGLPSWRVAEGIAPGFFLAVLRIDVGWLDRRLRIGVCP